MPQLRFLLILFFAPFTAHADDFTDWLKWIGPVAEQKMLANISPKGSAHGAVVASPSRENPDYFFHWIRDAGLVMDVVVTAYTKAPQGEKHFYKQLLLDFAEFSRRNQKTPNRSRGVGEPKFMPLGDAFNGDWGRPQDDGPAIRANVFIRWARQLLLEGEEKLVRPLLYDGTWDSLIKTDLEYVSHHWRNTSFDLWEENRGHHFFTSVVQRRALIEGGMLASDLGDAGAGNWYLQQARELEQQIEKHWNGQVIRPTMNRDSGIDYKHSGLDSSVILGVIHGWTEDSFLGVLDERVVLTVLAQEKAFGNLYPINRNGHRGILIGRYPEDRYNGYSSSGEGNPWLLTTSAFAEYYYRLAHELSHRKTLKMTSDLKRLLSSLGLPINRAQLSQKDLNILRLSCILKADDFLSRVQYHSARDGSMSEQLNRHSGFMQGARDLTWSYASVLTALSHR